MAQLESADASCICVQAQPIDEPADSGEMQIDHLGYHLRMTRLVLLGSVLLAAGCTKENPAARCSTGTCIDPAYPFCDVDGALSGSAGSCISVSCTPGDFKACRGDVALTCNAMGNNYDELQCQMGCAPEAKGCKLCQAGQTVCTNGELQTCDANGAVTSSETCPLGCFDAEPRCRNIDPSNGLAQYVDMATNPPDVDVASVGRFNTGTGVVSVDGPAVTVPSFLIAAPAGGSAVRVFVVHNFHVGMNAYVDSADSTTTDGGYTTVALAIVATGDITIDGTLAAMTGASLDPACTGHYGYYTETGGHPQSGASGGGGFATVGGGGTGVEAPGIGGGLGGGTSGTVTLMPLRGGCPAGGVQVDSGTIQKYGTPAGGAVQLSAAGALVVNGVINADGATGYPAQAGNGHAAFGGGAGGGILLEGATVTFGPAAKLLARGGGGGVANAVPPSMNNLDANPIPGVHCNPTSIYCGNGGNGAAPGIEAQNGGTAQYSSTQTLSSGGGGGGLGRLRINTQSGTYTKSSSSVEAGALTTGVVGTR